MGSRASRTAKPQAAPSEPRGRGPVWALVTLLLGAAATLFLAWHRPPRDEGAARARLIELSPRPGDLNVIVLTLDTLRADRLGCYGFQGIATPAIDRLAREGVLFEHATASVPLTFPSHASMFTGLVPPHHGVHDNGGFFLDAARTTLAERFQAAGYETSAFVGAWVLESRWGLAQGFEHYSDRFDLSQYKVVSLGTVQKRGDEVLDDALAWLGAPGRRKFFSWIHLYDPHTPYDAPEPYASRYAAQPYLAEVAYTDHVVGRLIEWLEARGLLERTVIVLTADHGESLGEHGESTHGFFVYDSTTSVPLIVRTPWGLKGRSSTQLSGVDLFPTVLDLAGLAPEPEIDGRSAALALFDPSADLGHVAYSETFFTRYHYGWQHLRALRNGRAKFIEAPTPEYYDLAQDPTESKNVYKAFSRRAEDLRQALQALAREPEGQAPQRQALDPETLQRLAALGYVGQVVPSDPDAMLPDPKDKIEAYRAMNEAKGLAGDERLEEAIAKMRGVLQHDPEIIDAHTTLGIWLVKLKRYDEGIEAYKAALALKPDDEVTLSNLASAYRSRHRPGDAEAALELYRSALQVDPKNPQTWFQLATLQLDLERVKDAEHTFKQAAEANPKMGAAWNSLGAIAYQRGALAESEGLIREGLRLEPQVRTGRFNLARVLEARGRQAEAEALYREELSTYPDHGRAHFNLAQLLRERGDHAAFLEQLHRSLELAPRFGPSYFFLAREQLDAGKLDVAADLARRGLDIDNDSDIAPLGHYVLADVYSRRGAAEQARAEVLAAKRLEAELRRTRSPKV